MSRGSLEPAAPVEGAGQVPRGKSLKVYALAQLAQREYGRAELRRKLLARVRSSATAAQRRGVRADPVASEAGPDAGDETAAAQCVEGVLDWLEAHRYLSEQRFVESRIRVRSERFGTSRIRHELAQHDLHLPAPAEAALLESEFERALRVCARKFDAAPITPADEAKRARFLAGRGFSGDAIRRVLRTLRSRDANPPAAQTGVDLEMAPGTRATLPR